MRVIETDNYKLKIAQVVEPSDPDAEAESVQQEPEGLPQPLPKRKPLRVGPAGQPSIVPPFPR